VKGSAAVSRAKVSADGTDVVSHAGVDMLREVADLTGLSSQVTTVLADNYRDPMAIEFRSSGDGLVVEMPLMPILSRRRRPKAPAIPQP